MGMRRWLAAGGWCVLLGVLGGCSTPQVQPFLQQSTEPAISEDGFRTADGTYLPLRRWVPENDRPRAVIVALHGFNDYSLAFRLAGNYFRERGIALYAYDQRGFGANRRQRGIWGGQQNLARDLRDLIAVLDAEYEAPLYVMGSSMGAAVAIVACYDDACPGVDGLILSAPAVWGDEVMNPLYRSTLWAMAHLFPASEFTGEDIEILATDNLAILRAMSRDPNVLKTSRVDAVYGIVQLMGGAYRRIEQVDIPILLLYGAKDDVIPEFPVRQMIKRIDAPHTVAYYPQGYHMLLRDKQHQTVLKDINTWIENRYKPLPSGLDMGWHEELMY